NGQDVTGQFGPRANGDFEGLLGGLVNGANTVQARLSDGTATTATIVNHPIGGPIFSGPQVQPWVCQAGATDAQCDAPTPYAFAYKDAVAGQFESYDPSSPPPAQAIATTTTDNGTTVPYIVRVETGYLDRDQYSIAVLWQPDQSWEPWAPQPQWDHKL